MVGKRTTNVKVKGKIVEDIISSIDKVKQKKKRLYKTFKSSAAEEGNDLVRALSSEYIPMTVLYTIVNDIQIDHAKTAKRFHDQTAEELFETDKFDAEDVFVFMKLLAMSETLIEDMNEMLFVSSDEEYVDKIKLAEYIIEYVALVTAEESVGKFKDARGEELSYGWYAFARYQQFNVAFLQDRLTDLINYIRTGNKDELTKGLVHKRTGMEMFTREDLEKQHS